jgi:hypothetical protein
MPYVQHPSPPTIGLARPPRSSFWLDREGAIRLIASQWEIDPHDHQAWSIGVFGRNLSESVETVSGLVFSPRRGLVGGPSLEILVLPVVPDSPTHPMMVGVVDGTGRIICHGIDDLAETLPDPYGRGPAQVIGALEKLLEIASSLVPEAGRVGQAYRPVAIGLDHSDYPSQEARVAGL